MDKTAKATRNIGFVLAGIGLVGIVAATVVGTGSEIGFRLITGAFFFYIPGVLLGVLGHLLAQLDQRMNSLEQKIDSLSGRSSQSRENS